MARLVRIGKKNDEKSKAGNGPRLVKLSSQPEGTRQEIPGLALPTPGAPRPAKPAETVPGLSLPTLSTAPRVIPAGGGNDRSGIPADAGTPEWARQMAARYQLPGRESAQLSPTAQWEAQRSRRTSPTGTTDFRGIPQEYSPDRKAEPTALDRAKAALSGAAKTYSASLANTGASLYDLTQGGRDSMNRELLEGVQLKYDQAKRDYEETEALARKYPDDPRRQRDLEASRNILEAAERELAAYGAVPELQRGALEQSYTAADQLAQSGQADVERAKAGLGGLGSFAVDVGVGGLQLGADIAGGIVTSGGTMLPLLLRSYGGGAQEARQEGATTGQAAAYGAASALTEALTEKISSLGNFQTKAFGSGALDDILEGVVGAVERIGKTEGGRKLLNRAASAGVGFLSEGAEEFVSGVVSPLLKRGIYSKEPIDWKETMEEAAYEFLVGGGIGAVSGGLGGTNTSGVQSQYLSDVTDRAQNDAYRTMAEKGAFSQEARQAARDAVEKMDTARKRSGIPVPTLEVQDSGDAAPFSPVEETTITTDAPAEPAAAASQSAEQMTGRLVRMGEQAETAARIGELLGRVKDGQTLTEAELKEVRSNPSGAKLIDAVQEIAARRAAEEPAAAAGADKNVIPEERAVLTGGFSAENGNIARVDQRMLDNLGKITQSEIRVVSQEKLDRLAGKTGADGVQLGNRIYISETAERPMMEIARHELTHRLQDMAPEAYGAFRDYVAGVYRADGSLDGYIQSIRDSRASAGIELSNAEIMDEIAADYAGQLLVDERAVRRLAGENSGLLERMLDGLREIIAKIRRAFGGKADAQTEELERAARLWENALRSVANSRGGDNAGEPEGLRLPKPRFSFGGKNARQADSGSLTRAQILESQGMAAEDIRKDTGWFRGMDGLWRFEIDDSGMEYSQWGDMRRSDRAESARFRELERKFIEGTITEAEQAELRGLVDKGYGKGGGTAQEELRLADYIRHDELFRNYPQLKGATLRFAELEGGARGSYNSETNTITISEKLQTAPEDTIIHEVQHAIQMAEGFARGSSPGYWSGEALRRLDQADADTDRLRAEFTEKIQADRFLQELREKRDRGDIPADEFYRMYDEHIDTDPAYAALEEKILQAERDSLRYATESDYSLYRNTAGEIEARDAAGRRTMTAEERRDAPPDLGDENTVFAEDDGETASIGYDEDNRPFVTVEEDILEGVPREDWVRTVKENLRKKFPNGVTVGDSEIEIDGTSRREMTWSSYSQWLRKEQPDIFADKLRATNNAGEIIRASRDYINEGLHHLRKDSIQDFARGTVQLRVGGNEYTADVIVGTRNNGSMLLYDLLNLKPTQIQEKSQGRQTATPSPGSSRSTATDSALSISRSSPDVKPRRTFSEEVMAQLTGEDAKTDGAGPTELKRLSLPTLEDGRGADGGGADGGGNRFSMKGDADIQKEVERLRRQNRRLKEKSEQTAELRKKNSQLERSNSRWKEQTKRTDAPRRNQEAVAREARALLKEYSSTYDRSELADRLQTLWDHQADRYGGAPWVREKAPTKEAIRQEAKEIAADILANNEEQVNTLYEQYRELRKELRTRGISIASEYQADLESAGGYEGLRKQYFGQLRLSKDGAAVDQIYDDLADRYPELFPDDILHPADQLVRITDVLDELEPVMGNTYEKEMDQAAEYLAGELLERFYDVEQKKLTFADKQAQKMAEARKKDREEFEARLHRKKRETEAQIKRMQEKFKERDRKRMEDQSASQRRETIRRHADRLGRMLLRPTDKQHIPEKLRGAALELVRQIDTGSNYFMDPDTGKRVYSQDEYQTRITGVEGSEYIQTRRTQAARELQAQYEKLAAEGGYTVDPDMAGYLDELAGMGSKALGDMSKAELDTVWKVMRVIEHCISKSDELLGRSRYATVSDMAERLREENGGKKDRRNFTGLAGTVDQLINMDMLTPETYFHKLGDAGEAIYKEMRSAADQQTGILKEGVEKAQKLTKESGVDLRKAEKELHTFSTSGGDLTLSTAQVMELYALSKREQALEHIYVGGLKPAGARKGLEAVGKAAPVKVTPSDVADIIGTLTAEQRKLADGLQGYLSGDLARHGNDASMAVYGYEKFKEANYWPIKVDRNQTKSDVKKEAESRTVAGYGMTKAVKPQARNAVVLRGILDSYTDHLNQMATYSGWLAASEDVNRVHNYVFTDGDGGTDGTVKTLLEQVYGRGGNSYLDKLMADIAMGTKAGAEPSPMDRGLNQFKAAKVGGNLRVILQQPTAIIRAANMLDAKYFLVARNPMKGWETAKKYSPIAQWKDWGYFELDTGRSLKELIAGESSGLEAVKNKLMEPAGMADSVAWGHLWNAVEAETAEKHPDLHRGSEEFYRKTAERFGEIIDRTQVVDSVLHRTQIMRSANSLTRMSTSFMSEPSKIYNMVYRDLFDVQQAKSGGARAKAGKALARSTAALIVSFAVNAVAQSIPDTWRGKDRDKELKEKFTDAYVSNFLENFDPVGYVPFLKDFESIIQGYSVERSDLEGFSDVVNALGQIEKAMAGESSRSTASAALELACKAGDLLGLPVSNIKRDAAGIVQTALQGAGNVELQYALDKLGLNPDKASATFYDDLYRAMGTDWDQYEGIYQDMIQRGWDKEKLAENMEKRMAREAGLEKASSLPVEYSVPGENLTFDQEIMRQLTGGKTWKDALPEGTLELARDIDQLEPEEGAESVTKMQKIRELRDSIWGDEVKDLTLENLLGDADYKRMKAARKAGISIEKWCRLYEDIADQKIRRTGKSGSPSQADVSAALEKSGLTEKQKDVIWQGYGWKGERVKEQEEESSSQLPGLSLPSLR